MSVFVLYIKEAGTPERMYGFHLGTDETEAKKLVEERWAFRAEPSSTVAQYEYLRLEFNGAVFAFYDGSWRQA